MPYLNWKMASLDQEVGSHTSREFQLRLQLGLTAARDLAAYLAEIFSDEGGGELRLDLPREWAIFWKKRDGESRLLMAHPQPEEWVATVALEQEHGGRLVEALRELKAGEAVTIGSLGSVGSVSNVEILISVDARG